MAWHKVTVTVYLETEILPDPELVVTAVRDFVKYINIHEVRSPVQLEAEPVEEEDMPEALFGDEIVFEFESGIEEDET